MHMYDLCHLEKDYEDRFFLRYPLWSKETLLPAPFTKMLMDKEVMWSECLF